MLKITDRVYRANDKYRANEFGSIVEIDDATQRARVLWDGNPAAVAANPESNYYRPKRTWMKLTALKKVVEIH